MIIENIQKLCTDRKIRWSAHSLARIQERGLNRNDVIDCILSGEIIEDYPEDSPHPSCLILGYADRCGEKYYSDDVAEELDRIVSKARELASEVFVTDYNKKIA